MNSDLPEQLAQASWAQIAAAQIGLGLGCMYWYAEVRHHEQALAAEAIGDSMFWLCAPPFVRALIRRYQQGWMPCFDVDDRFGARLSAVSVRIFELS